MTCSDTREDARRVQGASASQTGPSQVEPVPVSPLRASVPSAGYQSEVDDWMHVCFGSEIAADQLERADRFTEEALELAQTMPGFTADRAHALVDYVFNRPVGQRAQEVGGVMVTLAALCNTVDISISVEAERELARVWTKVGAIRAKQAAKPTGSALPIAQGTPTRQRQDRNGLGPKDGGPVGETDAPEPDSPSSNDGEKG